MGVQLCILELGHRHERSEGCCQGSVRFWQQVSCRKSAGKHTRTGAVPGYEEFHRNDKKPKLVFEIRQRLVHDIVSRPSVLKVNAGERKIEHPLPNKGMTFVFCFSSNFFF